MKQYLKDHKYYLCVMAIFTLLFALLVSQVVLYADDFTLHAKALTYDIGIVWKELCDVYMHWGGGPTPALAILTLMIGLPFWKLLNVTLITFCVHFATKIIVKKKDDKNMAFVALSIWSFIFLIGLSVARETLYWFDGSMAYVLTTFLTVTFFYYCYRFIIEKKEVKPYHYFTMIILGFFSGWNGPQMGAISVLLGVCFLLWQKLIQKEKMNTLILASTIATMIGFMVLYFAPGNAGRMSTFPEYEALSFFGKISYRLDSIFDLIGNIQLYPGFQIPLFLTFFSILLIGFTITRFSTYKGKKKKFIIAAISVIITYQSFMFLYARGTEIESLSKVLTYFFEYDQVLSSGFLKLIFRLANYIVTGSFLLSILYLSFDFSKEKKYPFLIFTVLSASASQVMMVMAPYSPFRSTYISIIFIIFGIVYLMYELINHKNVLLLCLILSFAFYDFTFAVLFGTLYLFLKSFKKDNLYLILIILIMLIPTLSVYTMNLYGYYRSRHTNDVNVARIEKAVKENQTEVVLCKLDDESYSFTPIYSEIEWIRTAVLDYYDFPKEEQFIVVECK